MLFITEHGSEYQFDAAAQTTTRLKKSGGSGQGEIHPPMNVVFIRDKVNPFVNKVRVCYREGGQAVPIQDAAQHSQNNEVCAVLEICRKTGEVLSMQRAHWWPTLGMYPYEWDGRTRHVGNKIVEIGE